MEPKNFWNMSNKLTNKETEFLGVLNYWSDETGNLNT